MKKIIGIIAVAIAILVAAVGTYKNMRGNYLEKSDELHEEVRDLLLYAGGLGRGQINARHAAIEESYAFYTEDTLSLVAYENHLSVLTRRIRLYLDTTEEAVSVHLVKAEDLLEYVKRRYKLCGVPLDTVWISNTEKTVKWCDSLLMETPNVRNEAIGIFNRETEPWVYEAGRLDAYEDKVLKARAKVEEELYRRDSLANEFGFKYSNRFNEMYHDD